MSYVIVSKLYRSGNVRFPLESGRLQCTSPCLLSAMCGRLRVGKSFLHVCSIGRCSHVFGLSARHMRPLAIMPSADQVPVKSSHSMMLWPKWGVLIAGTTGSALRAVRPSQLFTSRRVAGAILFRPLARPVPCNARLLSSWPRPSVRVCWRAQWPRPWSGAAPAMR